MSGKRKVIAPDFGAILAGGSDVKMDAEAVGGPQSSETADSNTVPSSEPTSAPTESPSAASQVREEPAPRLAGGKSDAAPAAERSTQNLPDQARAASQYNKPKPVYEYERIQSDSKIEETWIQTNVKMHPGVRTSYSEAVRVLKNSGQNITGRRFVHDAMNAMFLTMAPFNEYTQRLHDEADTQYARKPEDRPGESAEQWRPPLRG